MSYFPVVQYWAAFLTSIQYLCIVSNIVTQTDEAGFEFLGTKCAGVVLIMQCTRQPDMQCQEGGHVQHREGEDKKGARESEGRGGVPCSGWENMGVEEDDDMQENTGKKKSAQS